MIDVRRATAIAMLAILSSCERAADDKPERRVDLAGAGATFPYPLYRSWFAQYGESRGVRINYFSVGSTEGLRLLDAGDVDFGASDKLVLPLKDRPPGCDRLAVPMVMGPVAIVYNLPVGPLNVDAALLAGIFSGRITRWSAREIAALNPGVALPSTGITVVHRGSGSGTSAAFRAYLVSSGALRLPAAGDSTEAGWPVGISSEGNEGVAVEVKVREGSIGYVQLAYARQNQLNVARIRGTGGAYVEPSAQSSDYPIVAKTWLVIDPQNLRMDHARHVHDFVVWALREGAEAAKALEYTPMPADTAAHYDSLLRALSSRKCARS